MLIDSTALRSSLYDSQAKRGVTTRYHWFKGYKLHLCTTAKGIILSYALNTANRNDAAVAPELLASLEQWDIEFMLRDDAYDREKVRQTAEQAGILFLSPINRRKARNGKMPMDEFFLSF